MKYNEVGQLVEKYLHSPQTSGSRSFLQKVDYQYNIRGWLTKINDPDLSSGNDLFGMQLNYNTTDGLGSLVPAKTLYNGNIAGIRWNIKNDGEQKGYVFSYDNLNRLLTSSYAEGASLSTNINYYNENITEYDDNGNIKKLERYYNNALVDNLTYYYIKSGKNTNQLQNITDPAGDGTNVDDYTGNSSTYVYDDNGNMKTDGIRGTTTAYFSSLNLPDNVFFGNDNRVFYYYTAGGTKVGKHVKPNSTNPQGASESYTHYIGNIVYEGGKLSYIITEEGRLLPSGTGSSRTFVNEYNLKDHLGNNRVTFMPGSTAGSLNIVQKAHYYPFGLVMKQTNEYSDPSYSKNKYLYNGKEYQDETLNQKFFGMYDYGARFYDPQIGRFHTQDRFAEKYCSMSPYQYGANNPISNIDVNGDSIWLSYTRIDADGNETTTRYKYVNGKLLSESGGEYDGKDESDPFFQVINDQLNLLKKASSEANDIITSLEESPNEHTITNVDFKKHGEEAGNYANGYGKNSKIHYDPLSTEDREKKGANRFPSIGLIHELLHGYDIDKGHDPDKAYDIRNSKGQFISPAEIKAVNVENTVRRRMGLPERTTIYGAEIPRSRIKKHPDLNVFW